MADPLDTAKVAMMALSTVCLSSFLQWLFIYRTKSYKQLFASIEKTAATVEKLKNKTGSAKKSRKQTIKSTERLLQEKAMLMHRKLMPIGIFTFVVFIACTWNMSSHFGGRPVALLPFHPPQLLRKMTHRNVAGDDMTHCSMHFLMVLLSVGLRSNIGKLMGVKQPKGMPNGGMTGIMERYEKQMEEVQRKWDK